MSSSHRQDIFLDFYYSTLDLYHTIEIRNRKGYRSRNLLQNARMILFKPTGMPLAADFNFCLPWWHIGTP